MSSSAKLLEKREIQYLNQKIEDQKQKQIKNCSQLFIGSKPRKKTVVDYYNPDLNCTLKHVNPMYKRNHWSATKGQLQRQKMK